MSKTQNSGFRIEIPADYFARTAAKEYSDDAGMALIREFAQNSTDAGATVVHFKFNSDFQLVVTDDGKGCSAETVRTKLLAPLGTQKEAADAIGGFGKAKELLYLANPSWRIQTRDVDVQGSMLDVQRFDRVTTPVEGFIATVTLPETLWVSAKRAAPGFFDASERPGVRWLMDGLSHTPSVVRSRRATKDFGFCKAYLNRDVADANIYLRTSGLLTSIRAGYHGRDVGQVVLELTGASSELLTPARDWFRSYDHRRAVESWLNSLVVDARETLRVKEGAEILFHDMEDVEVQPVLSGARAVMTAAGAADATVSFVKGSGVQAHTAARSGLDVLNEMVADAFATGRATRAQWQAPAPVKARKDGFDMACMPRVEGINRVTVHTGNKTEGKAAMKWLQKNAALATKALAAWRTAVGVVAERNGAKLDAVGFVFTEGIEAEYVASSNGRFAYLLNPLNIDLSASDAPDELIDRALHEVAHRLGSPYHDERFVCAEFAMRRKVRGPLARGAVARSLRTVTVQAVEELS